MLAFGAVVGFVETILYTTLAPLVPQLSSDLHLSKTQIGAMVAAYPAGLVLAAVPSGYASDRLGPRATAACGLWMLAAGSIGFAVFSSPGALYLARFVQGAGSAAAWAGTLSWLAAAFPMSERGTAMGVAITATFCGILFGPVLGAIAASSGRLMTFGLIGLGIALVGAWGGPHGLTGQPVVREPMSPTSRPSHGRSSIVILMSVFMALGVVSGTLVALGPLVLTSRGLSSGAIATCFVVAAVPQILLTTTLGRKLAGTYLTMFCISIMLMYALLVSLMTVPQGELATAIFFSAGLAAGFAAINPLYVLASALAERWDRSQGRVLSLANGAWGAGAAVGALGFARVADVASISMALLGAGLVALTTTVALAFALRTSASAA